MARGWELTRRSLMRSWVVSLLCKRGAAAMGAVGLDPVSYALRGFAATATFRRHYRMDATILFLGAPIFTRQAAGGGFASVETGARPDATAVALQFAAGSDPARAHGLNRFGILQEAMIGHENHPDRNELSFSGLMTRSRE